MIRFALIFAAAAAGLAPMSWAAGRPAPKSTEAVEVQEHRGDRLPLDLIFRDDREQAVRLGDYFDGTVPVVLSLNYSSCPMLCSMQLEGMTDALKKIDLVAGRDFRVVVVSIDPRENATQAALAKERYVKQYGKPGGEKGWHFLTGTEPNIKALAKAVGFGYAYDEQLGQYAHAAVFELITPEGDISRYFYGVTFDPETLRLSLIEASEGQIGSAMDQIILTCLSYDSTTGKYTPLARNIMALAGGATVLVLALLLGPWWLAAGLRSAPESAAAAPTT